MPYVTRVFRLLSGCVILGVGVALILTADLGSDGFSTLVNGLRLFTGWPFFIANVVVSVAFLIIAATRRVIPGLGTIAQIAVVGAVASIALETLTTPTELPSRIALLIAALPVLAVGIALYLGSHLGAGPMEAAGLAWDPPIPFKWSYNLIQLIGAVAGWLLGATIGVATVVVILVLGPLIDLAAHLLRLDVHQGPRVRADKVTG